MGCNVPWLTLQGWNDSKPINADMICHRLAARRYCLDPDFDRLMSTIFLSAPLDCICATSRSRLRKIGAVRSPDTANNPSPTTAADNPSIMNGWCMFNYTHRPYTTRTWVPVQCVQLLLWTAQSEYSPDSLCLTQIQVIQGRGQLPEIS